MNDEKIVLIARLKVKADAVAEARQAALELVDASRAEAGCLNYDFHQAIDDETVFIWHETWAEKPRFGRTARRNTLKPSAAVSGIWLTSLCKSR